MTKYFIIRHFILIEMGQEAAEAALKDAEVSYNHIQAVAASYCYGDPTCGMYIEFCIHHNIVHFTTHSTIVFPNIFPFQVKRQCMVSLVV